MPKKGARYPNKWSVGELDFPPLDGLDSLVVDCDLMVTGLDETTGDVLNLFASLNEQIVSQWNLDGDPVASVAGPDVKAGVARAAMDGEEVEVGVEAGQDSILLAVLGQI